jgi:hypothetical protein
VQVKFHGSHVLQASLVYEMSAPLVAPRWLDGLQAVRGYTDERGLCIIIDIRYIVPSTGSSTPVGWVALPILHAGKYVASGYYQLPLFRGLPSMSVLKEMQTTNDVNATLTRGLIVRFLSNQD